MTTVVEKIQSRGHWFIVIRPTVFRKDHIEHRSDLLAKMGRLTVTIGGDEFPYVTKVDENTFYGDDWVQQQIDYPTYKEVWRFYQSGQFAFHGSVIYDWETDWRPFRSRPPNAPFLAVGRTLRNLLRYFSFASNIGLSEFGGPSTYVRVELAPLAGRVLWMDHPKGGPFFNPKQTQVPSFKFEDRISNDELGASAKDLAIKTAIELFAEFGWNPDPDLLDSFLEFLK